MGLLCTFVSILHIELWLSSPMMAKEFVKTHDQEFQYGPKPMLAAEILRGNKGMAMST